VLWDLAGQDDYRLIHALFLDDADLALVLFDPARSDDPLSGVEFWLKQLKVGTRDAAGTLAVLIAARSDRGTPRLTKKELEAFCNQRGIKAYLPTSANTGEGIAELIQHMQGLIPWDNKPATVTTETFKRIKDFVLDLKENRRRRKVILTPGELRQRLAKADSKWKFSDDEMLTAVGHLANHGYVTRLKTSRGELRILLAPELLNNLAASFILEGRRNRKGLGSLEEDRLSPGGYEFPELEKLSEAERDILVDSAAVLFLEHNVCFRETNPLHGRAYLVFPELINLKRPLEDDAKPVEDGVAYTVSGAVENVYASLVVLMGYTQTFTRTNQWRHHARYEVGNGRVCGLVIKAGCWLFEIPKAQTSPFARSVTIAAMAERLDEIGAAIPFSRLIRVGREPMRRLEQRIPEHHQITLIERERDVVGRGSIFDWLKTEEISLDCKGVAAGHERVGGIGKRGIKMFAASADPVVQGPHKFIVAPFAYARFWVRSNVGRIKRADHG
jgi:Ras family